MEKYVSSCCSFLFRFMLLSFCSKPYHAAELLLKILSVTWLHSNGTRGCPLFAKKKNHWNVSSFDLRALFSNTSKVTHE
jgi:hypothetical protein